MKTQMRVQKILMLVSLVVSALVLVFALIFMTGGLANVYRYIDTATKQDYIHCRNFVTKSQSFVSTLVTLSIVMIVLAAVLFLMGCHSRRKYYITNYIAIGAFVIFALVVAIVLIVMVSDVMNLYQNDIRWKSGEGYTVVQFKDILGDEIDPVTGLPIVVDTVPIDVPTNYADQAEFFDAYPLDPNQIYNFILGFVMAVIVIVDVVCVALCTAWKVFLMKGEKKLLSNGTTGDNVASAEVSVEEAAEVNVDKSVGEPVEEVE